MTNHVDQMKKRRLQAKLTQADVAYFISDQGREGASTVSKIEAGKINPSRATLSIYVLLSFLSLEQMEQAKNIIDDMLTS